MTVTTRIALLMFVSSLAVAPGTARAQNAASGDSSADADAQAAGLPSKIDWTFNFDAGWGNFGFANSFYDNPKESVLDNLSDQWFEGYIKPALAGVYTLQSSSEFYGKVSAAGERTYGSVPPAFGNDVSSFQAEDLFIGWRSESRCRLARTRSISASAASSRIGHGFLVTTRRRGSPAVTGPMRGRLSTCGIARFKPGPHTFEGFYIDKDELDESDSGSRLWGANYELALGESNTFGATYMRWYANDLRPQRNDLRVFNLRAYTAPIPMTPDLSFELEYAIERNGDRQLLDSTAWSAQGAYEFSGLGWKPKFYYRYAFFEGDDPTTPDNEAFDPLFLGFQDWGTWWQGEIAGEYFLSNSNLKSHLIRAHLTPSRSVSGGVLIFKFLIDHPESFGPHVTSSNVALETDAYVDWKLNKNFTVSLVGAYANPDLAVEQFSGRTSNFGYGMVYVAYSF